MPDDAVLAAGFPPLDGVWANALQSLLRESEITVVRSLTGGLSGAQVLLCDIKSAALGADGQYVVKLERVEEDHKDPNASLAELGDFASDHLPQIIRTEVLSVDEPSVGGDSSVTVKVAVFDIAGFSTRATRTLKGVTDRRDREMVLTRVATGLTAAQIEIDARATYKATYIEVFDRWLGRDFTSRERYLRLDASIRANERVTHYEAATVLFGQFVLPDPIRLFADFPDFCAAPTGVLAGRNHGDLHTSNIIVDGSVVIGNVDFWIIDANWAEIGPLFYDQAYLEVSLIFDAISEGHAIDLGRILKAIDGNVDFLSATSAETTLVQDITSLRTSAQKVLEEKQLRRRDIWTEQLIIARIAAGLNWASKPVGPEKQLAAFIYSAWNTKAWIENFRQESAENFGIFKAAGVTDNINDGKPSHEVARKLEETWSALRETDQSVDLFVIAGPSIKTAGIERLAALPISCIIDLDPDSDQTGLASQLCDSLSRTRRLNIFGTNETYVPAHSATNWLMANGWSARAEPSASGLAAWRRGGFLARARRLIDRVANDNVGQGVQVLIIQDDFARDMQLRILEYIDEVYGGIELQLDLSQASAAQISLRNFLDASRAIFDSDLSVQSISLPSAHGRHIVDVIDLKRYEVDLVVLHSGVRDSSNFDAGIVTDEFWRGRPPTFGEISAGVDVRREIEEPFILEVERRLREKRLTSFELLHSPGAGATTFAKRVSWEMMDKYPVLHVQQFGSNTGQMVAEISMQTDLPCLVFAEAAVVSDLDREQLLDDVAKSHGRCLLVRIRRSTDTDATAMSLLDPMTLQESHNFLDELKRRFGNSIDVGKVESLVSRYDQSPKQLFSPFFFGLTAFDTSFRGVDRFVENHLDQLSLAQAKIGRFVSLVTRYSQSTIALDIVRRWLGVAYRPPADVSDSYLTGLLGPSLRHLSVYNGIGVRLLHPEVAAAVLSYRGGLDHPPTVGQVGAQLIDAVHDVSSAGKAWARSLFRELFILRTGSFKKNQFAELVSEMSVEEGQVVFEKLTRHFPDEAHFWNHRGRFHIFRVRGDYRTAEKYLENAVEVAPRDAKSVHLHTLGLVRRLWVEQQIGDIQKGSDKLHISECLSAIRSTFDSAMDAFQKSRAAGEAGSYSWVTPVQLISTAVEFLLGVSGQPNLSALMAHEDSVTGWIAQQMHDAEGLLDAINAAEAERRDSREFYVTLSGHLDSLYGDIDSLVEQWRNYQELDARSSASVGCSMARAVFSQSKRSWADIPESRAREIAEMLWPAVEEGSANDGDLRLWIQAARRLPEFSESGALERLSWFAKNKASLDGAYYSYIIYFQQWARGQSRDQDRVREYLDVCRRLASNRRQDWSYEWLSVDGDAKIVHFSELGTWTRDRKRVWSKSSSLGRVRGVVDSVDGYRTGYLKVGAGNLSAFFLPQGEVVASRDINSIASCYVGFSYAGLRAWSVELEGRGPIAVAGEGNLYYVGSPQEEHSGPTLAESAPSKSSDLVVHRSEAASEDSPPRKIRPVKLDPSSLPVYNAILGLVEDRGSSYQWTLAELGEAVSKVVGKTEYRRFKQHNQNLQAALPRLGFELVATPFGWTITTG